jgi:Protein of unknown function (DUF3052)
MPGYSGTPLPRKLGVKPGATLVLVNAPAGFVEMLGDLPERARTSTRLKAMNSLVLLFCKDTSTLAKNLPVSAAKLAADGALWISWPKKSSALFVDLTEDGIRAAALPMGLVDVKVCAVSEDWSGLKLMVRKEKRPTWNG